MFYQHNELLNKMANIFTIEIYITTIFITKRKSGKCSRFFINYLRKFNFAIRAR